MDEQVEFQFRGKVHQALVFIDISPIPIFIFVELIDVALIGEFSKQVTITTNFIERLPRPDDRPALAALRQALFDAIKAMPEFMIAKQRCISASNVAGPEREYT